MRPTAHHDQAQVGVSLAQPGVGGEEILHPLVGCQRAHKEEDALPDEAELLAQGRGPLAGVAQPRLDSVRVDAVHRHEARLGREATALEVLPGHAAEAQEGRAAPLEEADQGAEEPLGERQRAGTRDLTEGPPYDRDAQDERASDGQERAREVRSALGKDHVGLLAPQMPGERGP